MECPFVLVIEDEASVREPLEKFLRLQGFDVRSAWTVEQALDSAAERPPDAAVIDLRLGQGSGRDVVVALPAETPVIIFSAVPSESGRLEELRPRTRLILKPFSLVMLAEMLRQMIGRAASANSRDGGPAGRSLPVVR